MNAITLLIETAERAYWRGLHDQENRRPMRVGEFFNNLSEETKEKLRTLKSDDFRKVRFDAIKWMCHEPMFPHRIVIAG